MNERQNALYEFLKSRADRWTAEFEIGRELYEYYGNSEACLSPADYHNTHQRRVLSLDVAQINGSADFEKIIISCSKGIKIASENEFAAHIHRQYSAIFRKLRRVRTMEKKARLHNQIGIDGETVDAFLEKIPENT